MSAPTSTKIFYRVTGKRPELLHLSNLFAKAHTLLSQLEDFEFTIMVEPDTGKMYFFLVMLGEGEEESTPEKLSEKPHLIDSEILQGIFLPIVQTNEPPAEAGTSTL